MNLRSLFIKMLILVVNSVCFTDSFADNKCSDFYKTVMKVDFQTKKITLIPQKNSPIHLCNNLPLSGFENLKLEMRGSQGELIFKRQVSLGREKITEQIKTMGKHTEEFKAKSLISRTASLMTLLPKYEPPWSLHLIDKYSGELIAETQ